MNNDRAKGLYEVKAMGMKDVVIVRYSPESGQFLCVQCGGAAHLEGGRFGPKNLAHMMEVLCCEKCGHAVDPALIGQMGVL